MEDNLHSAEAIKDIRRMMDKSSRFISLSGLSGVSAGVCALIGAWLGYPYVFGKKDLFTDDFMGRDVSDLELITHSPLFWIAAGTFVAAFISAFLFTWLKSKKNNTPIWGFTAKKLMFNVSVPLIVGGIFLLRLIHFGTFGLVAPGCLIFYGLALISASKYTLDEIRYLGYSQIILGLINLGFIGCGLYFWAAGFGVMHIIYGIYMWQKYDRNSEEAE